MRLKDAKIGFLGGNIRVFRTLSEGSYGSGVAMTLNPRLRALGLRPRHSAFLVGEHHHHLAAKNTDFHKHSTDKHNIVKICALIGRNLCNKIDAGPDYFCPAFIGQQ